MAEKVFGLTETKVQELVNKHNCIINRKELVPIVTIKRLKELCEENDWANAKYALDCLLSRVEKEASK